MRCSSSCRQVHPLMHHMVGGSQLFGIVTTTPRLCPALESGRCARATAGECPASNAGQRATCIVRVHYTWANAALCLHHKVLCVDASEGCEPLHAVRGVMEQVICMQHGTEQPGWSWLLALNAEQHHAIIVMSCVLTPSTIPAEQTIPTARLLPTASARDSTGQRPLTLEPALQLRPPAAAA